jgi:hypothetical protein
MILRASRSRAFTVLEMVVAIVVCVVVLGVALTLLVHATSSVTRSDERSDPREAACFLMQGIRQALADAFVYYVAADGASLNFGTGRGKGEVAYDAARKRIVFSGPGQPRSDLGPFRVTSFKVQAVFPGHVRVTFEVDRSRGGAPLRFQDNILILASTPFDPRVPWRHPPALLGGR